MLSKKLTEYFNNNPQYKTALNNDKFFPCRFEPRNLHGIVDETARFIEKIQLTDNSKWKLFSKQFAERPDGENGGWRGEYWGKMMRGACITYIYTQNNTLYKTLEKTVLDILNTQDELGRISTYTVEKEYSGWDIWCRKYIILGLLHFHEICKDEALRDRIITALETHLDYIINTVGDGKICINETSDFWGAANSVSLLEPVVRMFNQTGNKRYLEFAEYIVHTGPKDLNIFELAYENKTAPFEWSIKKAYELMSCFEGLMEYYRATGIEKWKNAVINFVDRLIETDTTIIGCCGCRHEFLDNSTSSQTNPDYPYPMQETCVTVTWMKLCYQLLRFTGDVKYADEIEKSIYNALYGAVNTKQSKLNGGFPFDSYSPIRINKRARGIGGEQFDENGNLIYGCCAAIGAAGTGIVPEIAASLTENGIVLNIYIDGEYTLVTPKDSLIKLNVSTNYPADGNVEITVSTDKSEEFEIMLRIPEYSVNTILSLNNENIPVKDRYIKIIRTWQNGDRLSLNIDMAPRVIHPIGFMDNPESLKYIAVKYGPLVLARDSRVCHDISTPISLKYDNNNHIDLERTDIVKFPTLCEFRAPCENGKSVTLIDYQSCGKTWDENSLTEAWMKTPYAKCFKEELHMEYNNLKAELKHYYKESVHNSVEALREKVYARLDEFDKKNPGLSSYKLKAAQYKAIAEEFTPVLFDRMPFYFETGALEAYSDGAYCRGGRHANGWMFKKNAHISNDISPENERLFCKNMSDILYLTCGPYFDIEHSPIPMEKIFSVGLKGVYEEAKTELENCESNEERDFIESAMTGLKALKLMAEKFSAEANRRLESETDAENIRCFELIAKTAGRVPWNPPATFFEGLATFAFMRKALGSLEGYGYNSIGRPDLLLEKFLDNSSSAEQNYDDMRRFMLIWDCHVDRDKIMSGYADYEYENSITVGGVDKDGNEVFNAATRMFVDAALELDLIYPKIMCRFSSSSSEEYLKLISKPLLKAKNIMLFENDDVMIPALVSSGYSLEDARNYIVSGCWGTSCGELNKPCSGEYFNLLRMLEWSIHMPGEKLKENALQFTPLSQAKSFEEAYDIFLKNTYEVIYRKAYLNAVGGKCWKEISPMCLTSALMRNPLKNRRDISNGGTGYSREQMNFAGFPDVVDSLSVIKKLCFDDKVCSLNDIIYQCKNNWPDEYLLALAKKCPSYGDGTDESLEISEKLNSDLYRITRGLPTLFGGEYNIGYYMYTEVVSWGKKMAATPNGRRDGYYISHGLTPTRIHEVRSVTDVLRTVSKLNLKKCAANSIINIMLPLGNIDSKILVDFIRSCAVCGIQAIQINCVNRDELLAAQKDPEHYKHIIVRVTGFSCPFVNLSKDWQNEVLSRNYYN